MKSEQKNFNSYLGIQDKQDNHKMKSHNARPDKSDPKVFTKKEIRKQKNRLAAQKSRDKKQIHLQYLQKQNRILKEIINNCTECSQKRQRHVQTQDSQTQRYSQRNQNQENHRQDSIAQIQIQNGACKEDEKKIEKSYLRLQDESSQNLSRFLTFCLIAALLCVAQLSKQKYMQDITRRLEFQGLNPQEQKNLTYIKNFVQKKAERSLIGMEVKQCKKCVQCFQNLTNNSSKNLVPILINETETNKTTNITNSLNKIILCKSKAAFFKRIYKAVQNSGMNASSSIRNVGKIQINGKQILELIDKDCLADVQFNQKKMYTVEFTLAILELSETKEEKKNLFHNISIEE